MSLNPNQFTPTPYTPTPFTPSGDASFTPTPGNFHNLSPFRFWCQKVLPLVYDDSLSYYEILCKVVDYLNKTMEDVEVLHVDVDNLHTAYENLQGDMNAKYHNMTEWMNQTYGNMSDWMNQSYNDLVNFVNTYFANLDVQQEINNKLDAMVLDGTMSTLVAPYVPPEVISKVNAMVQSGEFAAITNPQVIAATNAKIAEMMADGSLKRLIDDTIEFICVNNTDNIDMYNGSCVIVINKHDSVIVNDLMGYINLDNIIAVLENKQVQHIDYVVISHWHTDHCDPQVLQALITAGYIDSDTYFYLPRRSNNENVWNNTLNTNYSNFIGIITDLGCSYTFANYADPLTTGDLKLTFANNDTSDITYYDNYSSNTDYNQYSIITYYEYNDCCFGFMGDIGKIAEARMYSEGKVKKCNAITVGHHGNTNFDENFQLICSPQYGIAQTTQKHAATANAVGNGVMAYLTARGTTLYNTALGVISFNVNPLFFGIYDNAETLKECYLQTIKVYVDSTYTGVETGSSTKPFKDLRRALAFAMTIDYGEVIIEGQNFNETNFLYLNGFKCHLIIRNVTLVGAYIRDTSIVLENCTIVSTGISIRAQRSNVFFAGNTVFDGDTRGDSDTTHAAIYCANSYVRGSNVSISKKQFAITCNDQGQVNIDTLTIANVAYIYRGYDDNSCGHVKTLSGSPGNNYYADGSYGMTGALNPMRSIASQVATGTAVSTGMKREGNVVSMFIDIENLSLTGAQTTLINLTNSRYYPKQTVYIPILALSSGFGAGNTYYPAFLFVSNTGVVSLVSPDYASITKVIVSVDWTI